MENYYFKVVRLFDKRMFSPITSKFIDLPNDPKIIINSWLSSKKVVEYVIGQETIPQIKHSGLFCFSEFQYANQFISIGKQAILIGTGELLKKEITLIPAWKQMITIEDIEKSWKKGIIDENLSILDGTVILKKFTPYKIVYKKDYIW